MTASKTLYESIGDEMEGVEKSQMFGKPCLKINGKAFACYSEDDMVFKLPGEPHEEALSLEGSRLFDPSGKNRPMKEWVQVAYAHHNYWFRFAQEAARYVSGGKSMNGM